MDGFRVCFRDGFRIGRRRLQDRKAAPRPTRFEPRALCMRIADAGTPNAGAVAKMLASGRSKACLSGVSPSAPH